MVKKVSCLKQKELLFCVDNRFKTAYITAELINNCLIVRYSLFVDKPQKHSMDFLCKFSKASTKTFASLYPEKQFLNSIKRQFCSEHAYFDIQNFADKNNLKYKMYNHFDFDVFNQLRYNFGDIYDDSDRLYYEDGSIIIPQLYQPLKEGVRKIYTKNGNLYFEINYKNYLKNGVTKGYYEDSESIQFEQNYTNDLLDGVATTYYFDGEIKEKLLFKNGELIENILLNNNHWQKYYVF